MLSEFESLTRPCPKVDTHHITAIDLVVENERLLTPDRTFEML